MATNRPETAPPLTLGEADHGRLISDEAFASGDFEEPWKYERVGVMKP
jgi:hypothetical protein